MPTPLWTMAPNTKRAILLSCSLNVLAQEPRAALMKPNGTHSIGEHPLVQVISANTCKMKR